MTLLPSAEKRVRIFKLIIFYNLLHTYNSENFLKNVSLWIIYTDSVLGYMSTAPKLKVLDRDRKKVDASLPIGRNVLSEI